MDASVFDEEDLVDISVEEEEEWVPTAFAIMHGKEDFYATRRRAWSYGKRRKACPAWSLPLEVFLMCAYPCRLSKLGIDRSGIGMRDTFDLMDLAREETQTHRPDQRILPHSHLTGVRDTMINIHAHSRMTGRAPMQANVSQTAMLDKKNGVDGPAGLRIIHIFCGW